nr:ArsB/NhaD family transporter [Tuberibacillus sp. Marseille-P3662]
MDVIITCSIFIVCYLFIITEKLNRALVACSGGVLMVIMRIVDVSDLFETYIDWHTISLLFSMMIIVSITSQTGVFEYIAIKLAQYVHGGPILLLVISSTLTAIGSAFLDNVTTVLLFVPIVVKLTDILKLPAIPFLIVSILFANIGGTATLIGDPPNIMIGQAVSHLSFNDFLYHLAPIVCVIFASVLTAVIIIYRNQLQVSDMHRRQLMAIHAGDYLIINSVLFKSLAILMMTIAGFMMHPVINIDMTTVAMAGALLLLLVTYHDVSFDSVFRHIDWITLFFFIGLFMLVGGLTEIGIIDEIAKQVIFYTKGDLPKTALLILWGSGILSGFVDNIPFVAAMIPVIKEFQEFGVNNLNPLWWSLALGSCLGGNATLIGASANVIVAGMSQQTGKPISFLGFMKVGIPVVLFSLIVATIYVYFRYLIHYY